MKVAIMQPYFFPYIGYFQLMAACDLFVAFDDAQYISRGWVNRNRILVKSSADWLTLPVVYAGHRAPINQRQYLLEHGAQPRRLLRRLAGAYGNAPHFDRTMQLVEEILAFPDANVASFNLNLLARVAAALRLPVRLVRSSDIAKEGGLKGRDIVAEICRRTGATHYINPIGGVALYDEGFFRARGLELSFLQAAPSPYSQFGSGHVPWLSIIDVMMFNDVAAIARMLGQYHLVKTDDARAEPPAGSALPCGTKT